MLELQLTIVFDREISQHLLQPWSPVARLERGTRETPVISAVEMRTHFCVLTSRHHAQTQCVFYARNATQLGAYARTVLVDVPNLADDPSELDGKSMAWFP